MSGLKVVKDDTQKLLRATKALVRRKVLVGIPEDKHARKDGPIGNATIGYLNETGSPAQNIPARPHLVPGIEDAKEEITKQFARAGKSALDGDLSGIEQGMNNAGIAAATAVRRRIDTNIPPPLSERTLAARKKRGRTGGEPLVDTGEYRRAITHVIKDK